MREKSNGRRLQFDLHDLCQSFELLFCSPVRARAMQPHAYTPNSAISTPGARPGVYQPVQPRGTPQQQHQPPQARQIPVGGALFGSRKGHYRHLGGSTQGQYQALQPSQLTSRQRLEGQMGRESTRYSRVC
jgi:hypothetical protein